MRLSDSQLDPALFDITAPVVFCPVRHHSPACARLVQRLIRDLRPSAVLIEGPSDFNARLDELFLGHELPIAIYSYLRTDNGQRSGVFYPFCVYSPEWQALLAAREIGAHTAFIDLPWAEMLPLELLPANTTEPNANTGPNDATEPPPGMPPNNPTSLEPEPTQNRYADGELRTSGYVAGLCRKLGIEDFDALWDALFEINADVSPETLLVRIHAFCYGIRITDNVVPNSDLRREAFMAEQIRQAQAAGHTKILVVTGGFHSSALFQRLHEISEHTNASEHELNQQTDADRLERNTNVTQNNILQDIAGENGENGNVERGLALTPYSYERLDSLTGYNAGMPNPGFYHHVWHDRSNGQDNTYRRLLGEAATNLRKRKQTASSADLIAVETTARGLANLRGHAEVWRSDLTDGILGALVKEEFIPGRTHPFLTALHDVFRGEARGRLANGTVLPPLVRDIRQLLLSHELEPKPREVTLDLDLHQSSDLERSRVLHQLATLGIAGFRSTGGTDLAKRDDLMHIRERWAIRWTPDYDATCIEAAVYGPTLIEAAGSRLLERAAQLERDSEGAARLLLESALMGLRQLSSRLYRHLQAQVRTDNDFFSLAPALGHLLYLYRYDDALGTKGERGIGALLGETFQRGLWLLEGLGDATGQEKQTLAGVATLLETWERLAPMLGDAPELADAFDRETFVSMLRRTLANRSQLPILRGALAGALWTIGETGLDDILGELRFASDPNRIGDFLTGLFRLARETAQRHPDLLNGIDALLNGFDEEAFLAALPALRLAFSFFTPREKNALARTLFIASNEAASQSLPPLAVAPELAAQVMAFEARLFRTLARYGIRDHVEETVP